MRFSLIPLPFAHRANGSFSFVRLFMKKQTKRPKWTCPSLQKRDLGRWERDVAWMSVVWMGTRVTRRGEDWQLGWMLKQMARLRGAVDKWGIGCLIGEEDGFCYWTAEAWTSKDWMLKDWTSNDFTSKDWTSKDRTLKTSKQHQLWPDVKRLNNRKYPTSNGVLNVKKDWTANLNIENV